MPKFCEKCGKELDNEQEVCLGCGKIIKGNVKATNKIKENKDHSTYYTITSIIMLVLAFCLFAANGQSNGDTNGIYGFPALFALIGAIVILSCKNNKTGIITGSVCYYIGALINFVAIYDFSIFSIVAVIFASINMYYVSKMY